MLCSCTGRQQGDTELPPCQSKTDDPFPHICVSLVFGFELFAFVLQMPACSLCPPEIKYIFHSVLHLYNTHVCVIYIILHNDIFKNLKNNQGICWQYGFDYKIATSIVGLNPADLPSRCALAESSAKSD